MPRPRLLYVVTHPMTARLLLRGQIEWMQERGFDVTVVTSDDNEPAAVDGASHHVRRLTMAREISPLRDLVTLVRLVRLIREIRPEVVNASTPKAGLLGSLAARIAGVPVRIYTLRGLRAETETGWRRRLLLLTERLACAAAQRVLCVSESLRQRALDLSLAAGDKLLVAGAGSSNGIDVARFDRVPNATVDDARAGLGLNGGPVIGFVGRLTRDKGIDDLRALYERIEHQIPEARLLLVGGHEPGDPVAPATRRWLAEHPGVLDVGAVEDPSPYYPLMHVLAFPSKREGLPNVPLEAAAAGVPAVGYRVTGTVDAIEDGVSGALVEPGDLDGLTDAVLGYLHDRDKQHRHGQAAHERVATRFRPEIVWEALRSEYLALMRKAGRAVPMNG